MEKEEGGEKGGVICYDRIKQNVQQQELFWGLGRLCAGWLSHWCCSQKGRRLKFMSGAESERSTGSVGREKQRAAGRH